MCEGNARAFYGNCHVASMAIANAIKMNQPEVALYFLNSVLESEIRKLLDYSLSLELDRQLLEKEP